MKPNNRRRRYWINPPFQRRFLTRILLLELIVVVATAILSLYLALLLLSPAIETGPRWTGILTGYVLLTIIVGAVLIYLGIRVSHQICGRVHHIRQVLEQIRRGGESRSIQLRESDELQDLAKEINATLDHLRDSGPAERQK